MAVEVRSVLMCRIFKVWRVPATCASWASLYGGPAMADACERRLAVCDIGSVQCLGYYTRGVKLEEEGSV
eukprot:8275164-Pyramimonas_sp.AAC.1